MGLFDMFKKTEGKKRIIKKYERKSKETQIEIPLLNVDGKANQHPDSPDTTASIKWYPERN